MKYSPNLMTVVIFMLIILLYAEPYAAQTKSQLEQKKIASQKQKEFQRYWLAWLDSMVVKSATASDIILTDSRPPSAEPDEIFPTPQFIESPLEYWGCAKKGKWETEDYWIDSTLTMAEIEEYDFMWSGQCMIGVIAEDVQCGNLHRIWQQADSLRQLRKISLPTRVKISVLLYFDTQAKPRAAWITSENAAKELSPIVFNIIRKICCIPALNGDRNKPMPTIVEFPFVFF